uniref:DDE_3 domain-containing protein n=1 Tax=Heterorhabditis bacteriophora TaxID=37862 RepID=A0A1I7XF57_HETBA
MIWGAFSSVVLAKLTFVSTKMKSTDYQDVCGRRLVPYLQRFSIVSFPFQQYYVTIHASKSSKTWLEDNDVATMDWLSCSPNLNPMENFWRFSCVGFIPIIVSSRSFQISRESLAKHEAKQTILS